MGAARFGEGLSQFRKEFDEQAHQAGESLGGIYGKPAAEALTPENQTADWRLCLPIEDWQRRVRAKGLNPFRDRRLR